MYYPNAAEMAYWVKSLPQKHADLSSDPWRACKMLDVVVRTHNLNIGKAETRGYLASG